MKKKGRATVAWSELPKDLLETIARRLQTKTDVTRFRSVCKSWRSSVPPYQSPFLFPLLLPYYGSFDQHNTFLSLTQTTLLYLHKSPSSSSTSTSWGWLIRLGECLDHDHPLHQHYHLINPFSPLRIRPLPRTFPRTLDSSAFRVCEVAKAYSLRFSDRKVCNYKLAFYPNPKCPSLLVVACGTLWCLKLLGHDNKWRVVDDALSQLNYDDVVLHRGKFYAVDDCGRIVLVDPSSLLVNEFVPRMKARGGHEMRLATSRKGLLLVDKCITRYNKAEFRLYKLEMEHKRLVEVKSLDDHILFLGHDYSFSVSASYFGSRCKGNCIVFADPAFRVYSLGDGKVSPIEQHPEYIAIFYPPSR